MRRVVPFVALLLTVFWLPVTQHCGLEAAGLLTGQCGQTSRAPDKPCPQAACKNVESGAYRLAGDTLKVSPPDLLACACVICLHLTPANALSEVVSLPAATVERPLDWVPIWHFVRRAAPLPRAPALLCA